MAGLGDMFGASLAAVNGQKPRNSDRIQTGQPLNLRGAFEAATNIPVVGDALSGGMAMYDAAKGDYGSAAMNALGVLPFVSGTFIGKGAKTWDAIKAADAEKRIAAGDDVRKVWKETGTFKGPDGHLRQEIPDNQSFYRGSKAAESSYAKDVYLNEPLYQAYPGLQNTRISEFDGLGGSTGMSGKIAIGTQGNASSTAAHEMQHDIQGIEGWARGGSTNEFSGFDETAQAELDRINSILNSGKYDMKDYQSLLQQKRDAMNASSSSSSPYEQYRRLAGEAEARATQSRMYMNMDQRLNIYPLDSYDVPVDQLIVRGNTPIGAAFGGK